MTNSLTEENYLKGIFHLSRKENVKISLTAIAEEMGVNAASVVDMIKKLVDKNFITYEKSKGAALTKKGKQAALSIIRNHRLWEVFLVEKLGYAWDEIHDIAEQLEHTKHPELADRLDKFLNHPLFDPHGDPIPKSNGEMPKTSNTLLSEIPTGIACTVVAVKDTSSVFLQYLQQISINIGTRLIVVEIIPFDGSMVIEMKNGERRTVSGKFSDNLLVEKI